jgi:hypothetical protein
LKTYPVEARVALRGFGARKIAQTVILGLGIAVCAVVEGFGYCQFLCSAFFFICFPRRRIKWTALGRCGVCITSFCPGGAFNICESFPPLPPNRVMGMAFADISASILINGRLRVFWPELNEGRPI